jgi:hypothetical protein
MVVFMSLLALDLIALSVFGSTVSGRYPNTVVAVVSLVLICAVGIWTFTRRHNV